jgi:Zn-dependent M28 family amino/carboxypeptidase
MSPRHVLGFVITLLAPLFLTACSGGNDLDRALRSIQADGLKADIRTLSSDTFEGRGPATPAEERTVDFLIGRFKSLGLEPGNGGSWVQEIPLVEITTQPGPELVVEGRGATSRLRFGDEYVAQTRRIVDRVELERSGLVFVGYGIVAPEFGWDDYRGVDVRGKTVVMLINDPGFATKDSTLFHGTAMTYYGRWTYKFDEAARQGAAGVLIVHETEPAAYPWGVVENSFTGPQMNFRTADRNMSLAAVEGWITAGAARKLFHQAGRDYDELTARAERRGFRAVPLGLTASVALDVSHRDAVSKNVLALIPGRERKGEVIMYTAHWDHLGIDTTRTGDQIFNGALDNATGVSGLLSLAGAFKTFAQPPARSVLFIAVTCEEQGLLGSEYYAEHPVFPIDSTVAAINMDAMDILGPMKDITVVGWGNSELDDYLVAAAKTQGRLVRPDPEPEKGGFFRSDQFSLAKRGVPVLYTGTGTDHVTYGSAWTKEQSDKFIAERYHKPSDEFDPSWDLSGMVDDLRLLFMVGYRLSGESTFPKLKTGGPFEARREWRG